jgi:hypothetical protein
MTTVQPCVSHASSSAAPDVQSEWLHVPCGGSFPCVGGGCEPAHWPFEQVSFVLQAMPQPPQLFGSLVMSTHWEPHVVCVQLFVGGGLVPLLLASTHYREVVKVHWSTRVPRGVRFPS